MIFDHSVRIPANRQRAWSFLLDVPSVAACIPGAGEVEPIGENSYRGNLRVKVGPIGLTMAGDIAFVRIDPDTGTVEVRASATDRKVGGSVRATMTWKLTEVTPAETDLTIHSDVTLLGKIGEFGQPLIRKKADTLLAEFAANLRDALHPPE